MRKDPLWKYFFYSIWEKVKEIIKYYKAGSISGDLKRL